jgi:hypothetical protein
MDSGPSKAVEAIVAALIPPACREEVLGDLHERFKSRRQYAADALLTVPLVILSRMRRIADPQVLLIQAFALYMSFLGAAWLSDGTVLHEQGSLLRIAIPAAMALLGLILEDTYAHPGRRSLLNLVRGPLLGLVMALASQGMLWISNSDLALPRWITFYGCGMSLLLSSAVRMLFPPVPEQLLGANAPALWLKQAGGSGGSPHRIIRVLKGISAVIALAIIGTWIAERSVPPKSGIVMLLVVLVIAYQVSKRG